MTQANLMKLLKHFQATKQDSQAADILAKYPDLASKQVEAKETKSKRKKNAD